MSAPHDNNDLSLGKSAMRFIENLFKGSKLGLREFARKVGTSHQLLSTWIEGAPKMSEFLTILTRIQKLSKMSDSKFWKLIREEFEDKE